MTTQLQTQPLKDEKPVAFTPFGGLDEIKLTVSIVKRLCAVPTKTGKLPDDAQCIRFMMLCQAQRLNPFAGDAYLIGYDSQDGPTFSLVASHSSVLKRATSDPDFDGMESGVIVADADGEVKEIPGDFYEAGQEVVGGWAKVYHKKRKIITHRRLRVERFNKGFGEWKKDAAGMICKCAEADALRSTFPTLCGGLYLEHEMNKNAIEVDTSRVSAPLPSFDRPALAAASEPTPEPATPAPVTTSQPANGETAQSSLEAFLGDARVPFSDFQSWLITTGTYAAADSIGSCQELPSEVCAKLANDPKALGKVVKLYGKAKA